jgi:hypothetical protein
MECPPEERAHAFKYNTAANYRYTQLNCSELCFFQKISTEQFCLYFIVPGPQTNGGRRMQRNREANGADEMGAKVPDAGALLEAQRAATENATRMANTACHYALSLNRAWLDLWESHLAEYLELPKRFLDAQTSFIEQTFDHYQESMQKLGSLASKATREAQSAMRETEVAGERVARQLQSETKEMGWGNRPKEGPMHSSDEERLEPAQHNAH